LDEGEITLDATGRSPHDEQGRPSSIPNIPTPITVTHKLAVELLYSVWGEDTKGDRLPDGGPGMVRALVVEKPTAILSCGFTPEELRLPTCKLSLARAVLGVYSRNSRWLSRSRGCILSAGNYLLNVRQGTT
jgi:hypothetical protein